MKKDIQEQEKINKKNEQMRNYNHRKEKSNAIYPGTNNEYTQKYDLDHMKNHVTACISILKQILDDNEKLTIIIPDSNHRPKDSDTSKEDNKRRMAIDYKDFLKHVKDDTNKKLDKILPIYPDSII